MTTINGTLGDDVLRSLDGLGAYLLGAAGNDKLYGSELTDTLDGGSGVDLLAGGKGNDTYIVDLASDKVVELAGQGEDTVISHANTYTLAANVEHLLLAGAQVFGAGGQVGIGNNLNNRISVDANTNSHAEIHGMAGNDLLIGSAFALDILDGGAGDDTIQAIDGKNDQTFGGAGNDIFYIDEIDFVTELANGGIDTIHAEFFVNLGLAKYANVENVILDGTLNVSAVGNALSNRMEGNSVGNNIQGLAGHDYLIGYGGNDVLVGDEGNDILDGGDGKDEMRGGAGNDVYYVDAVDDIFSDEGGGIDEVRSEKVKISLIGTTIENAVLFGAAAIDADGNELANTITGNDGKNKLNGGGGNDILYGGLGNDELNGGDSGEDKMSGGKGDDTYHVNSTKDLVIEKANEGTDIVYSSITYKLGTTIENLTLEGLGNINGTGNTLNNVMNGNAGVNQLDGGTGNDALAGAGGDDILIGGAGNDTLEGGTGNDKMSGGAGDDLYTIDSNGDIVTELANGGVDTIYTKVNIDMAANVENVVLLEGNHLVVGNDLANIMLGSIGIDELRGGKGNDVLMGNRGDDTLFGGDGDDSLEGGLAIDTFFGGTGKDVFIYAADSKTDIITISGDIIADFESGQDKIDLHSLLMISGLKDVSQAISSEFLKFDNTGADSVVSWDADGVAGASFTPITLVTVRNTDIVAADFVGDIIS